jgi:hypothetical protein
MASFLMNVEDNEDGWGPLGLPAQFSEKPFFSAYNKSEKIGKAADWQQQHHPAKCILFINNEDDNFSSTR